MVLTKVLSKTVWVASSLSPERMTVAWKLSAEIVSSAGSQTTAWTSASGSWKVQGPLSASEKLVSMFSPRVATRALPEASRAWQRRSWSAPAPTSIWIVSNGPLIAVDFCLRLFTFLKLTVVPSSDAAESVTVTAFDP